MGGRGETKDGVPAGRLIGHRWFVRIIWGRRDHMRYRDGCVSKAIRLKSRMSFSFHFHMRLGVTFQSFQGLKRRNWIGP